MINLSIGKARCLKISPHSKSERDSEHKVIKQVTSRSVQRDTRVFRSRRRGAKGEGEGVKLKGNKRVLWLTLFALCSRFLIRMSLCAYYHMACIIRCVRQRFRGLAYLTCLTTVLRWSQCKCLHVLHEWCKLLRVYGKHWSPTEQYSVSLGCCYEGILISVSLSVPLCLPLSLIR